MGGNLSTTPLSPPGGSLATTFLGTRPPAPARVDDRDCDRENDDDDDDEDSELDPLPSPLARFAGERRGVDFE